MSQKKSMYEEPILFEISLLDESAKGWSEPAPPDSTGTGTESSGSSSGGSTSGDEPFKFVE